MYLCLWLALHLALSAFAIPWGLDNENCGPAGWQIGQPVQTTSGLVQGHASSWKPTVSEYLGIPYAQPPLGDLRFAAPQPYKGNGVISGSNFSADCLQYLGAGAGLASNPALVAYGAAMGGGSLTNPHNYSEDCLTVNVWTKPQVGEEKKAVMLWIYGGAFTSGTSNAPFYDGARLVDEEDVVVASFNYRINIFGFPQAPGLPDANPGLLDQRLAVEWVRDNIAGFGGDPTRITLFGESAGGFSVDLYSYAWTQDPIVNGFIAESGTAITATNLGASLQNVVQNWYNISATLGCGGAEAGAGTVSCMRTKPANDILNAYGKYSTNASSTPFQPVWDNVTVFADTRNRSAAGQFIKKPMLIGNNDNELGLLQVIPQAFGPALGALLNSGIGLQQAEQVGNDVAFNCPCADTASGRANNSVPVWRYRYMSVWPNTALAPDIGAYHSSEIPLVFGATELKPNASADTPDEARLSAIMRHAWATFAKDPANGLNKLGWPLYDPTGQTLIRLGYQNMSMPSIGNSTQYDGDCAFLEKILG